MPKNRLAALPILLLACPTLAPADEAGTALVEQHCVSCHGSEVYTRPDRRIHSLADLEGQVRRCTANLQIQWFDDEILAVTDHLNRSYYRFEP